MSRVIAIANQKGGVGKTAVAVNLPVFLTALGKKVLLVDVDPQANATFSLGIKPRDLRDSLYEAMMGTISPREIIRRTPFLAYDIMPTSHNLAGANVELITMENREFKLKDVIDMVKDDYDYVLIDCPPSLGILTLNGLVASDEVLIPVQAEYLALEGLSQLLYNVKMINENLERNIKILGALLTMYSRKNLVSQKIAKDLRRTFPGYVFEAVIPRTVALSESPIYGRTILRHSPNSAAVHAFRELAREIVDKENKELLRKKITQGS
ncbi:MAG TPA: AAA family ATPase [Candidatus Pacearchaeota archaeon]|jgi:chromosome partitioning protein|nr:AAA family ATPase [Candidatus Pacearchaeota archaeon]HRR94677.1 AAA family ATPase [Candidatus Paceibacterota bacterium]HPC30357.1 AAA family ATPase [Candidatus Pacearchaeota archaeon]HQG09170.1 AAA family ATPase [Candidatus Pacearchaeota archaeon]HQH20396.1 AAA family ATPase [Candidatus Pacearchaeota archaeon]